MTFKGIKPVSKPKWVPFIQDEDVRPPWTEFTKELGRSFAGNVAERVDLARQRKEIDATIKDLDAKIKEPLLTLGPVKSVAVGDIKVTLVSQTRTSIVREMMVVELLNLGIDPESASAAVDRATKTSQSEFVKITAPKEDADGE